MVHRHSKKQTKHAVNCEVKLLIHTTTTLSMALLSSPFHSSHLLTLSTNISSKPHFSKRPHLPLLSKKNFIFWSTKATGADAVTVEEKIKDVVGSSVVSEMEVNAASNGVKAPPEPQVAVIDAVPRRTALALMLSSLIFLKDDSYANALVQPTVALREYIDSFDGYTFKYPKNWIQVRGAGADIFFRDPFILDENLSMNISSPSSSNYKSVEDLGPPEVAGEKILKQYLTEFMSTRLGVRRESNICSTSSRVADDGKLYYQVEVNVKSFANNNELAVMPESRVARLEWDRRYFSVLAVENKQLYELRLQTPENVFLEEESDLRQVMDSFRVFKVTA